MRLNPGKNRPAPAKGRRRFPLPLIFILLLAAIFRFSGLGAKSLWLDEVMTVRNTERPYAQMIEELKGFDAHPPLFQTVEWLWLRHGQGDGFARIPSAVAGVVGVWLAWLIARRLFGYRAGLCAATLLAFSHFHIYYSQEARLYALVTTLFLAQIYLLLRILEQRGKARWPWWVGYGLLTLATLYTYALCIFTIAALAVVYLLHVRKRPAERQLAPWVAVHLIAALLFLPWLPVLGRTTARVAAEVKMRGEDKGRPTPEQLAHGVASWGLGPLRWKIAGSAGSVLGAALLIAPAVGLLIRRTRRPARILAILFFVPLIGYIVMPAPRVHEYDPKHLAFLQPLLLIALAGIRLPARADEVPSLTRPASFIVYILAALNFWLVIPYYGKGFQKERWREACAYVMPRLKSQDAFVFNPERIAFPFEHYARSSPWGDRVRAFAQRGAPLTLEHVMRVRAGNPNAAPPALDPSVQRVWVIECVNPVAAPYPFPHRRLDEHGFAPAKEPKVYSGFLGFVRTELYVRGAPAKDTKKP